MAVFLMPAAVIAAVAAGAGTYIWYWKPSTALRALFRLSFFKAGMKVKAHKLAGGEVMAYAERGNFNDNQSSIVFVHGYSASKESWVAIVEGIPKDVHVIAVDLIGHGDSSLPTNEKQEPSIRYLTESLHELLVAIGVVKRPVHMVGISMGGSTAAMYASIYPEDIKMLSLVCPAMYTPLPGKAVAEIRDGRNYLLPQTVADMNHLLDLILFDPTKLPRNAQMLKGVLQLKEGRCEFYQKLYESIGRTVKLEGNTRQILTAVKQPTQLIWGENDLLVDVSGAEFFKQHLPDCRKVDLLKNCGHAATLDLPETIINLILNFRSDIK